MNGLWPLVAGLLVSATGDAPTEVYADTRTRRSIRKDAVAPADGVPAPGEVPWIPPTPEAYECPVRPRCKAEPEKKARRKAKQAAQRRQR